MRSGKWKLHFPHAYRTMAGQAAGAGGTPGRYVESSTELALYDLETDVGERTDVAARNPDVVERLKKLADQAREELGDSATKQVGRGVRPAGKE